jgi:tetratricopeptide (TPR) repeat protein
MESHLDEANKHLGGGDPQKALEVYWTIARADPRSAVAHQGIAQCQYQLRQYAEATGSARTALRLDPALTAPRVLLAYIYAQNGDLDAAHREAQKAIELAPNSFETANCYGVILAAEKKYEEAAPHLRRATEIDPWAISTHHNLAIVYGHTEDSVNLLHELRIIYRLQPSLNNGLRLLSALHHEYLLYLVVGMALVIVLAGILLLPGLLLIPTLYVAWLCVNVYWEFRNRRWRAGASLLLVTAVFSVALWWFYSGIAA